ncbi:MAG: CAP domain-containing protein [Thermoleophilia bacterium]|jgi:uncharacterized protein YkwD|nr:CAP domain-containing protein [Thermoleophilia bacterium]
MRTLPAPVLALALLLTTLALLVQPSAAPAETSPAPYVVTLELSSPVVGCYETVTYSGRVTTASGAPAQGTVTVQKRLAPDGAWINWRTARLSSTGRYAVAVTMTNAPRDWQFRTRMPGTAVATTGFSPVRDLRVEAATPDSLGAADAEERVVELVNKERTSRGLAPVRLHESLLDAARAHSSEMARRGVLTHLSADGSTVAERLIEYGYTQSGCSSWKVGEDIGRGDADTLFGTPEGVVMLWMDSAAHREVILEPTFRDVGVGVSIATDGMRYFTLDMGRRVY